MSDLDLLGVLVGTQAAENLLQENQGSLYQLFQPGGGGSSGL
jgi:hypothetical protein